MVRDAAAWVESRKVAGLTLEVVRLEGRTPVIFFEIAGDEGRAHRHRAALRPPRQAARVQRLAQATSGPWTPKYENGLLYGRGGADDGYAVYAAITAIEALNGRASPRPRCVGIIESCEESGSSDLPAYIDALRPRLGNVGLVVCLDSGAGNYDQLWLTTSLRGMVSGVLKVEILTEGMHSGDASGLVPSSFRILRQVLDRLEDSADRPPAARELPLRDCRPSRLEQARATAAILGDEVWKRFPWACGADGGPTLPTTTDPVEALLNRTWRPTLSVTGVDGFPELRQRRQRAAAVHRVQALPAPAAAGRRQRGQPEAEDAARGQRAVQRQGHLPRRRPRRRAGRHRLERARAWRPGWRDALNAASQRALRRAAAATSARAARSR